MQDQPSNSQDSDEPSRDGIIPDDWIWYPELKGWSPPGADSYWDPKEEMQKLLDAVASISEEERRRPLISREDLRAAGVLDVPAWMRKSLRAKPPEDMPLFAGLDDEDDPDADDDASEPDDDDESADDLE